MACSGAGTESPAEATPDNVLSASKHNKSTTNPLAAILGYEYVPGQHLTTCCGPYWWCHASHCLAGKMTQRQKMARSHPARETLQALLNIRHT